MAQSGGQEKTEKATPRKLSEARRKGQVAKSADLNGAVGLLAMVLLFWAVKDYYINLLQHRVTVYFRQYTQYSLPADWEHILLTYVSFFMELVAPIFLLAVIIGLAVNISQVGFLLAPEALKPKLERMNPAEGIKRMFALRSLFELAKSLLKVIIFGVITCGLVVLNFPYLLTVFYQSPQMIYRVVAGFMLKILGWGGLAYLGLALLDFLYQRYEYQKNLKMTKQEVKDEHKQTEGDPLIKSKQREKQRQISLNRIKQEVPRATVVVTNPTHLAVAIRYQADEADVPVVVAKGQGYLALRIREIAREHKVPVVEQKELARLMYPLVEVGQEIPYRLYQAVAEILAQIYKNKSLYL